MKIIMYIPTLGGGGAERVFANLANYFSGIQNVQLLLVINKKGSSYNVGMKENVRLIFLKTRFSNIYFNLIFHIFQFAKILLKEKPDIILSTLTYSNIIAFLGHKLVLSRAVLVIRQANVLNNEKINYYLKLCLGISFRKADLVIANSPDTKKSILNFTDIKSTRITVIGNPVYEKDIIAKSMVSLEDLKLPSRYLLNVGSLRSHKNHKLLINSFAIVAKRVDCDLIILGEGELRSSLEKTIIDLGLENRVHLLGFTSNPYPYYRFAELFLLSSRAEGFGNVIVEAMSFGIPVVATDCKGGPAFILENGKYGDLVKNYDVELFAEAILANLADPNKFDKNAIIARAKDFSIDSIGKKYFSVFEKMI